MDGLTGEGGAVDDRVTVNGVSLRVRDRGEGKPIVFIHGVMCSGRLFDLQLEFFSRGYRVVVPDLRGHGDSEKSQSGHTVSNHAKDLRELFEARGVEHPVLVGWSMGAMIAFEYLKMLDRKSTRLNSSHIQKSRMPSSA